MHFRRYAMLVMCGVASSLAVVVQPQVQTADIDYMPVLNDQANLLYVDSCSMQVDVTVKIFEILL